MSRLSLGVHCTLQPDGHFASDGNVALMADGKLLYGTTEDRVTRIRYHGDFRASLQRALEVTRIEAASLEDVGVSTFARPVDCPDDDLDDIRRLVATTLGRPPEAIEVMRSHHEAHAFAAAAYCPFERFLVCVLDNEGSILGRQVSQPSWRSAFERSSYYLFDGNGYRLLARDHCEAGSVGYGKAYSKVTRYCGFRSYQESGKTMGLAAFGDSEFASRYPLFDESGSERCSMSNSEDGLQDLAAWFALRGFQLPPPRDPAEPVRWIDAALARWIQNSLEQSVLRRVSGLLKEHQCDAIAMAGGVALNSVMNARLRRELPVAEVCVPPSPGDAGLAVGVVAWLEWRRTGRIPKFSPTPFIGSRYHDSEIAEAIAGKAQYVTAVNVDDAAIAGAEMLAQGRVIGWFQGAAEFGPRALGHRSILADPRNPWMKEVLNNQVKLREWFRPYAPAVLREFMSEVFESNSDSPYMMHVGVVRPSSRESIPSAMHVDGTARLQTVVAEFSPKFARLIQEFWRRTNAPAVLNTSFNLAGEPIVETPADAIDTFLRCRRMDGLLIEDRLIRRRTT